MIIKMRPAVYQLSFHLNEKNNVSDKFNSFVFKTFVNSNEFLLIKIKDHDHKVHINPTKKIITITGSTPLLIFEKSLKDFKKNFYSELPIRLKDYFKNCIVIDENKDKIISSILEEPFVGNMKFGLINLNCAEEQQLHGNYYFYRYLSSSINKEINIFDFHFLEKKIQVDGLTSKQGLFISILFGFFSILCLMYFINFFNKKQ